MKNIIFIGGRANTKIAAEIIKSQEEVNLHYYSDREFEPAEFIDEGFSIIENIELAYEAIEAGFEYFVGIGGNKLRQEVSQNMLAKTNHNPINIISKSAQISPGVIVGSGNLMMHQSLINLNSTVGCGNIFNTKSLIEHDCQIGSFNHIAPASTVLGYASIGDLCEIYTSSVIFPYKTISSNVTIGANSTVTQDILVSGKYFGSPAKIRNS
jgi:sugar O-acyltransferase (sialic acid O-acetyltransferase NeuD family)